MYARVLGRGAFRETGDGAVAGLKLIHPRLGLSGVVVATQRKQDANGSVGILPETG